MKTQGSKVPVEDTNNGRHSGSHNAKHNGRPLGDKLETRFQGSKVPRFPESCVCMRKEGKVVIPPSASRD